MEIATIVGITTGLTQAIKTAFNVPSRFSPVLSIVIGTGLSFLMADDLGINVTLTLGIIAGLASSGLYDVTKKTVLNK